MDAYESDDSDLGESGEREQSCPDCGLTRRELYAHGHMGCVSCYGVFGAEVERALIEIHGKSIHIGKVCETHGG
jgi:protein-arginine kinase activator protein McsA